MPLWYVHGWISCESSLPLDYSGPTESFVGDQNILRRFWFVSVSFQFQWLGSSAALAQFQLPPVVLLYAFHLVNRKYQRNCCESSTRSMFYLSLWDLGLCSSQEKVCRSYPRVQRLTRLCWGSLTKKQNFHIGDFGMSNPSPSVPPKNRMNRLLSRSWLQSYHSKSPTTFLSRAIQEPNSQSGHAKLREVC